MKDTLHKLSANNTHIPTATALDKRLSWQARGLLLLIITIYENDLGTSGDTSTNDEPPISDDTLIDDYSIRADSEVFEEVMDELIHFGYAKRVRLLNESDSDEFIDYEYRVADEPVFVEGKEGSDVQLLNN